MPIWTTSDTRRKYEKEKRKYEELIRRYKIGEIVESNQIQGGFHGHPRKYKKFYVRILSITFKDAGYIEILVHYLSDSQNSSSSTIAPEELKKLSKDEQAAIELLQI